MPGPRPRVRRVLSGVFAFVLDWLYVGWWQVFSLFTSNDVRQYLDHAEPRDTVVIMLPGVYEPWRFMKPLSDLLYRSGYHVYVIPGLGYNTGHVPQMADIVRRFIEELDSPSIVLVAHSKGGLIGKYLLAHDNADGRVKHLMAINSPFAGSIYANFAPVQTVRIFSTRDATIRRLQLNRNVNRTITSIYSVFDPNIPRGSHLEGATNISVDLVGHFRIVGSPELHERLLEVLADVESRTAHSAATHRTTEAPEIVKPRDVHGA